MSDWIQTFTGKAFWPLEPERSEIDILDIAHALSMKCRFGGHCKKFYSVAEHCLRVALIVAPSSKGWGLMHDAAEAYLPDLLKPIKQNFYIGEVARGEIKAPGEWFSHYGVYARTFADAEKAILISVAAKLELAIAPDGPIPKDVKAADLILLATEARDLMGDPPQPWNLCVPVLPEIIVPMLPSEAERLFLSAWESFRGDK